MQLDPGPGEDLVLAIQRQVVRVFTDEDICEDILGGQAALNWVRGLRILPGLDLCHGGFRVQLALVVFQLFRAFAMHGLVQLSDQMPHPRDRADRS